jgi:hypothetical protein
MSPVRSSLLGMMDESLFPDLPPPAARARRPRRGPGDPGRPPTSRVVERLRYVGGRRVTTSNGVLLPDQLADLSRAARFAPIEVRIRIPTSDRRLAAVLDPTGPPLWKRFRALRDARRAGLSAGVAIDPLVPGLNAHEPDLARVFEEARRAGALFVDARVVLPAERRRAELARELRRRYPRVAARLEVWRRGSRPPPEEREEVERLLEELGARFDLPRSWNGAPGPPGTGSQRQFAFAV